MAARGRPRAVIDLKTVRKLAEIQCTISEISAVIDVPEGTLKNRDDFTTIFKKGIESGKSSLRRTQFKLAQKSAAMAIWLGKQYLDQVDTKELVIPDAEKYFKQIADAIGRADTDTGGVLPG